MATLHETALQHKLTIALALVDDVRAIMVEYGDTAMTAEIDKAIADYDLHAQKRPIDLRPNRLQRKTSRNKRKGN